MFDIIGKRFRFFLISGIVILVGSISLLTFGLKSGIEFSSGSMLTVDFKQEVAQDQLKQELADLGYGNVIIQRTGAGDYLIRTPELSADAKAQLEAVLAARFGDLTEPEFSSVSPMIATETARTATIAVAVAAIGILLYVTWAFRRMPKPFHYGTCAIIALAHDALVALGIFSILGGILNWQINLMFITGILAVIGYSVNNTVVIFDRIRENLRMDISVDFETIVNNSLVETLGRSVNTSLTTLIVVLALLLFVGATIQNFVAVLMIGIIAGTFSSICIAPALLVVWDKREWGRFVRWLPLPTARTPK
ncbi:MAG: protein translocase subunit SecF [Dehalococcoidales bacterium]|jgi:preprotein translocase subunit SecF|nr:protein translocase subunit SecF [Dehalococcoidales bacterium]MDP7415510.1 protein translocase subunit SecF [Dehalococcoidales bacterium]